MRHVPPEPLTRFLIRHRFARHPEFPRTTWASGSSADPAQLTDFLFLTPADPHDPSSVFPRLRWGGQVVLVSPDPAPIAAAASQFANWRRESAPVALPFPTPGKAAADESRHPPPTPPPSPPSWIIEQLPTSIRKFPLNLRFLPFSRTIHYFVARKVALIEPGRSSDRFTYNVHLARDPESARIGGPRGKDAWQVVKEVPTIERVLARLREKFPDADADTLARRARKFTDKIFPVFLTRETAILKLLQRDLPPPFRHRVPQVLSLEQDSQGYTRTLRLNWLRNGLPAPRRGSGPADGDPQHHSAAPLKPLRQLEFARQSAELLAALHDHAHIMHLDLRLDNFVITPHGVGFVDFGSAVRVGESFPETSLLSNLFGEMMRTSQIQRMLGQMSESGQITSQTIRDSYHRVDKAVDFFYLAVQINNPHANPDFIGLVQFDKNSPEARELSRLTSQILRPADPKNPTFKSAKQILDGIHQVESRLQNL